MSAATEQLNGKAVTVQSHLGHHDLVQIIAFQAEGEMAGSVVGRGSGPSERDARISAGLPADPPKEEAPEAFTEACAQGLHRMCNGEARPIGHADQTVPCCCPCHHGSEER